MEKKHCVIFCTVPNLDTALRISQVLVKEKIAACCNIVPGLRSIYSWEGKICDETEYLLIIKSNDKVYNKIEKRIQDLHPYETPEILSLKVNRGLYNYLKWMDKNVE